jgi:RNA polymerase sigma-70 factor (ECF subfamily)
VTFVLLRHTYYVAAPVVTNLADLTTDELVSLVRSGDTQCFEEIIRRYQREVMGVISHLLYDRAKTEELVQQVFVKTYLGLPEFRLGSDFGPWIRTIARNTVRQELRSQSRYDRRLETYWQMLSSQLVDDRQAEVHRRQLQECLDQGLQGLPEREKMAIELRYHEGKTFEEIAGVLGITAAAARNLLCRVRAKLRESVLKELKRQ